ncbi:murein biosynthesis integral membrane protein MurJ [Proteiniborus sp. MB09-C3]|uniref:murein biosynthesis integral membrane protein MurJ n=1 Tax=Proteiniborus sp. MB09-C3 TaxID=3050072 RepID=UPI002555B598|nr:murein biosynthesis integral membrane protein MurJ [Proteiniborus sp. MB09-C3]WIV12111.1 murein biosynthesis integral membrane protein MurJ [Proteiniborus sp. MB09-C3]
MKKTVLILIIISISSKIIGFVRDIVLSYYYGISFVADAYLISTTLPLTIFAFVGVGIATTYIPLYNSIENDFGVSEAEKFTNDVVNFILVLCSIIVIIVLLFTVPVIKLFASGFNNEVLDLTVSLTRISVFGIYFTGLVFVFKSYLQIKNNFVIPGLIGIPSNLIVIASISLSGAFGTRLLAIGSVLAVFAQVLFLTPSLNKNGYKYRMRFNPKSNHLKQMIKLALPASLGVSVDQINVLIDRTIASNLIIGGIAALNYSNRLIYFVQGLFVTSIATVFYPRISKMLAQNEKVGFKKSIQESIIGMVLLIIPSAIGLMILSKPIIEMLFGRGAFNSQAIKLTSSALFFYSLGIVGVGLREILSRVFYAMQDTKTPVINASLGMVMNITLNIILSRYIGINGLALATSISATFTTFLLFISLRKKIGPFGMKQIFISFLKILFASLVMGLLAKLSFNYLITILSHNFSLIIAIGFGAVSYFVIICFMKFKDVDVIVGAMKKKIDRMINQGTNKTL